MFSPLYRPGISYGVYPQKLLDNEHLLDRILENGRLMLASHLHSDKKQLHNFIRMVNQRSEELASLGEAALNEMPRQLQTQLAGNELSTEWLVESFALVKSLTRQTLGMAHYDEQLMAGWGLVHGRLAEMATGEGKTLSASLAAASMALTGTPVHVITANDYLAQRDAEFLLPLYQKLGLDVGIIREGMTTTQRRAAYAADITYCSNKEVAFDYMRDRLALNNINGTMRVKLRDIYHDNTPEKKPVLRGLCYAIVDEADSVLIDDANTPLIIANEKNNPAEVKTYKLALSVASKLQPQKDFELETMRGPVHLTEQGQLRVEKLTSALGGLWTGSIRRDYFVELALTALHVFSRDQHYLVNNNQVRIIDENTGRTMQDRSWEAGLHQMIECKEGCPITGQRETVARLSYPRFFSHYHTLSGMTGTARECLGELRSNYQLQVLTIPTHKPVQRQDLGTMVFKTNREKWRACIARVHKLHTQGRPVLIGTRSVASSELLSNLLNRFRLPHRVLNAKQDHDEAGIIAQAGKQGQITVATNMAGRGTDIKISQEVNEAGGLHVIIAELNDEARIDRQLYGRSGRQGENGSYEFIFSLEETPLTEHKQHSLLYRWLCYRHVDNKPLPAKTSKLLIKQLQKKIARKNHRMRNKLLDIEEQIKRMLAFTGE